MKRLLTLIALCVAFSVNAAEEDWSWIGTTSQSTFSILKKSGQLTFGPDDVSYTVTVRGVDRKNRQVQYFRLIVQRKECLQGVGTSIWAWVGGGVNQVPFVVAGDTANDALAGVSCAVMEYELKPANKSQPAV